jgi:mannan endo-1,4-beta-mannosidase
MLISKLVAARRNRAPQFHARNGVIYDPSGNLFVPVGANLGTNLAFDWRGTAKTHGVDAVAWGWNCVRLNILSTDNVGYSWLANNAGGIPAFLNYLDTIVQEYTSLGIAVHCGAHDDPKTSGLNQTTFENQMVTFWAAAAAKWKDNPYVWYNPINEPRYANEEWVALHRKFCSAIRGAGAKAPIICDAPGAGQDLGPLSWVVGGLSAKFAYEADMAPVLNSQYGDIIVACHNYGAKWDTQAKAETWIDATRAAGLTPLFDEFGYTIDGSSTAGSYQANYDAAQAVFAAHASRGVGISWWHGTHGDNYSLKLNGNAFWDGGNSVGLSAAGVQMWNLTHGSGLSTIPQTIPFLIGV